MPCWDEESAVMCSHLYIHTPLNVGCGGHIDGKHNSYTFQGSESMLKGVGQGVVEISTHIAKSTGINAERQTS